MIVWAAIGFVRGFVGASVDGKSAVASNAERQYEMAKRHGSAMDRYTRAALVAETYLQAGDEPNYKKWRAIQREEATAVGMPFD
ncbi:MAG TPA: hypothetical protein VK163_05545 [Opitutaceae bacterium]|nr:hypothetical protein [Opitutaceae bacterium]